VLASADRFFADKTDIRYSFHQLAVSKVAIGEHVRLRLNAQWLAPLPDALGAPLEPDLREHGKLGTELLLAVDLETNASGAIISC
jgi:hypothetical protein